MLFRISFVRIVVRFVLFSNNRKHGMQQFSDVITGINHTTYYARFVSASFAKLGLPDEDAAVAAETLLATGKSVDDSEAQAGQAVTVF
jgi:hypothetical protein